MELPDTVEWPLMGHGAKIRLNWGLKKLRWPPGREAGADPARFDWAGVTVGHWRVERALGEARGGFVYRCVSRCGVHSPFTAASLSGGATKTCEACRPRVPGGPPPARGVAEHLLAEHQKTWETPLAIEYRSNLRGDGFDVFKKFAEKELYALIDRTGLGRDFGWKCLVRDCHNRSGKKPLLAARQFRDGAKSVELKLVPAEGGYWFELDLSTGRADRPWSEVRAAVEAALAAPGAADDEADGSPDAEAPAGPPGDGTAAAGKTILGGVSVDKLLAVRGGLDKLITLGQEAESTAQIRAEAEATLAKVLAEAEPLRAAAAAGCDTVTKLAAKLEACKDLVRDLNARLQAALATRDETQAELESQTQARDRAASAFAPVRQRLADAEAGVAEAARLEEERLKTLAKAGDMAVLLAAFQRLGG
jgi:hypothetical protein